MRTTTILILAAAALLAAGPAACSKQEEAAPPSASSGGGVMPTDVGSKIGSAAGQAVSALADNYADEIKQQQSQVDALKTSAQTYADDKINGLITSIQSKLEAAQGKLNEIKTADQGSAQALGQEIQTLLGEAKKLYDQATARLAELKKG